MAMDETNLAMGQTRLAMDKGTLLENFFENFFLKGNYEFKIFFRKFSQRAWPWTKRQFASEEDKRAWPWTK